MTTSPVLLLVFNRPATTRRVLEALRVARPPRLLVVADGPRSEHPDDERLCEETRALFDDPGWPCEVTTEFSSVNLGCRMRCISGLDWAFAREDRAIVLEDDCVPHPTFVPFCSELLERYRDDERVHMIRGTNFLRGRRLSRDSYYSSRFCNIWGWATWARAWRHYDGEMRRWPQMRDNAWLESYLPSPAMAKLARYFFEETYAGRLDAWDYQWVFAGWLRNAHCLVPATNLVTNIGFGIDATHTRDAEPGLDDLPLQPIAFPLRHPRDVHVNEAADRLEWELMFPALAAEDSIVQRLAARMGLRWRPSHKASKS
ncbi:MAG TPA: glycosyltransferase family 2 protein [Verrucomicrobiae bacterium]|nr:glycosyltransferase family 2 protein [Verrucomicrobiae bacterium]